MSFNKRYFDIDGLIELYRQGGLDGIKNSFAKIDAFIIRDDVASSVYNLICKGNDDKAINLLEKQINKNKHGHAKILNKKN
jgi:hypothetical protein